MDNSESFRMAMDWMIPTSVVIKVLIRTSIDVSRMSMEILGLRWLGSEWLPGVNDPVT